MKPLCVLLLSALLSGCATGMKRDSLCLASITAEYLQAERGLHSESRGGAPPFQAWNEYRTLARWQEKVYQRLITRLEERQILTDTFFVLLGGGPGLILYPVVHWNVHAVLCDGEDPDSDSNEVTAYCRQRLSDSEAKRARKTVERGERVEETSLQEDERRRTLGHDQSPSTLFN